MAAEIIPFMFKDAPVRTVERDGEPWFVGRDVCAILDISKVEQALGRLESDERGTYSIGTPGGLQAMIVVSEPGVYRLIFSSRKAEAEEFKRWLAHEVLPQIRKTGKYAPAAKADAPLAWDEQALGMLNAKLDVLREYRRIKGPAAATRMWTYLGLPEPTAIGERASEVHDWMRCLRHFLTTMSAPAENKRWGAFVEEVFGAGDFYEEIDFGTNGMRLAEEGAGLIFANGHDGLAKIFAKTPWANGRWRQALKRAPGARSVGVQRYGGVSCRGVLVPTDVLLDAAIAADPR